MPTLDSILIFNALVTAVVSPWRRGADRTAVCCFHGLQAITCIALQQDNPMDQPPSHRVRRPFRWLPVPIFAQLQLPSGSDNGNDTGTDSRHSSRGPDSDGSVGIEVVVLGGEKRNICAGVRIIQDRPGVPRNQRPTGGSRVPRRRHVRHVRVHFSPMTEAPPMRGCGLFGRAGTPAGEPPSLCVKRFWLVVGSGIWADWEP